MKRWNTRKTVLTAMLAAVAAVLMFIEIPVPLLPPFIKLDISDVPALIAAFSMGPLSGILVCFIKNLLHLAVTTSGGIGEVCNALLGMAFVLPASLLYHARKNRRQAFWGALLGAVCMAAFSVPLNYFITYPVYARLLPLTQIIAMYQAILPSANGLLSCLLIFNMPFTFLKGIIETVLTFLIYKPLSSFIKGENHTKRKGAEIFSLKPAFQDYIWGGTRLRDEWGKECDFPRIAESWEVSCHENGLSRISETGETLRDYLKKHPEAIGTKRLSDDFPVLMKLIDAQDDLSVQVHPDEKFAMEVEHSHGKTEMWYVVDALPDASVIYGLKEKITREEMEKHIQNGTFLSVLRRVPVKTGDVFFIPAGTIHAIGKGCLIAEIQQSSDITYRVYDYDRKDANGKKREIHVDKAIRAANLEPTVAPRFSDGVLGECEYFSVREKTVCDSETLHISEKSFLAVLVLGGEGSIGGKPYKKGDAFFVPAKESDVKLFGNGKLLLTSLM